ncbi:hypothetical protein GCM10022254_25100 [Actinomadura meridiana]|uniref:DUF397 domain-containing protein n=1 Tax=Actinomadura meridiana TaxID=559626 RepID=A0ABP8BZ14_9ACTN
MMIWRKSSRSSAGGQECVEIAATWRKSSRSSGGYQNCVELASVPNAVLIRDSKDATGPLHMITPEAFRILAHLVKSGGLDS